ncbi:MAG: glutamate racemase [Bacteroidia bacterium]|nr:glutamate racemase [Bacteroidia bacterium]MDW8159414.1 glutamate racemase [Bacteroidia bacterium]
MHQLNRAIGVFDSGLGGLTIVKAIKELLPKESVLYYGDTAHLPYGDKSPEVVRSYIRRIARFLASEGVKAIVVACNTASAVLDEEFYSVCQNIPVVEVITPAVQEALRYSARRNIGVIGTKTTIQSHIYLKKILEKAPNALVVEKATPLLVPLIEEGWQNQPFCSHVIEAYLSDTGFRHIDTLILGCTHYPVIQKEIESYFAQNFEFQVKVVNSSYPAAYYLANLLEEQHLLNSDSASLPDRFYVSDLNTNFLHIASSFLDVHFQLEKLSLETAGWIEPLK